MKKVIFIALCLATLASLFSPVSAAGPTYTEYYQDPLGEILVGVRATGTCYLVWGSVSPYKLTAVCH